MTGVSGTVDAYAGKTLAERMTGRFYTPDVLASDLAARLSDTLEARAAEYGLGAEIRACDPFCGDGRLVVALLVEAMSRAALHGRRWVVTLCDVERGAAEGAGEAVATAAAALGVVVVIRVVIGDSLANATPDQHDIVVTNPPWELLKPDIREVAHLTAEGKAEHRARLRVLCNALDARFPEARADKAWGGWGTNLARCGWELALRSCTPGGALGIVLPSTILADQASATMRSSALRRSRLVDLAAYPSEARLFARVDQPVVAATFVAEPSDGVDATLRLFGADRAVRTYRRLEANGAQLAARSHVLPVGFGAEAAELIDLLSTLPRLSDLEGDAPTCLWTGRELDETRIIEKTRPGTRHPFVKGRMVRRHGIAEAPTRSVLPDLARGFRSAVFERVAWRDVSRASQRRRMISTIIPAGWVAGNSLHVAHFRNDDPERLRALHAILSSFVFELQVRSLLATGHMSLGVVRCARVPVMGRSVVATLAAKAREALSDGDEICPALEVAVARAYGLGRDDMAAIIDQFPKIDSAERDAVLNSTLWANGTT